VEDFTLTVSGPSGVNVRGGGTATYTLIVTQWAANAACSSEPERQSELPLDATATFSSG